MGVVLLSGHLREAGLRARVVRPQDPPFSLPKVIEEATERGYLFGRTREARVELMWAEYQKNPGFFEPLVDRILAGGERVIALCAFVNSADVTLVLARIIKQRRPESIIVIGGPDVIEQPQEFLLPGIDVAVGMNAEAIIGELVHGLLENGIAGARGIPNVWFRGPGHPLDYDPAALPARPKPPHPAIDYPSLVPLLLGDKQATMPVLLNQGCPYRCGFCSNKNLYSFGRGEPERLVDEIDRIMVAWSDLHVGTPPGLSISISDATTNAIPDQLDDVLDRIIERRARWPHIYLRGQMLFDARITHERCERMKNAGWGNPFFGLETGSDRLRKELKKPGKIAEVVQAIKTYHEVGAGGLSFGIPVGIPGETDADFEKTVEFFDWAMGMPESIKLVTVLPYVLFDSAQDPTFATDNHGGRRILWRMNRPGGDPAVRARRYMRLHEVAHGRIPCVATLTPHVILPAMLPDVPESELNEWLGKYGAAFDQMNADARDLGTTNTDDPASEKSMTAEMTRVVKAIKNWTPPAGWSRAESSWKPQGGDGGSAVTRYTSARGNLVVVVTRLDPDRPRFCEAGDYAVSYANQWQGVKCVFDEPLLRSIARELEAL